MAVGLLLLLAGSARAAIAQEEPPVTPEPEVTPVIPEPEPRPVPPEPAEKGVTLKYKWVPGQMLRYRVIGDGVMNMRMQGAPMMPGAPPNGAAIPMQFEILMDMLQRVKKIHPDGSATLVQRVRAMMVTTRVMGMEMRVKLDQGKFAALLNGKPMPLLQEQMGGRAQALTKSVEVRMTRRGQILSLGGAAQAALQRMFQGTNLGGVLGNGTIGAGMLTMPAGPVLPGRSWSSRQSVKIPIDSNGGGLSSAGPPQLLQVNYAVKNTCAEIEEGGGRVMIESEAEATLPRPKTILRPAPRGMGKPIPVRIRSFKQQIGGLVQFDSTAGVVRDGEYDIDMGMLMEMPTPVAAKAAGAGTAQIAMDASFRMKVLLVPERTVRQGRMTPGRSPERG
jgi:hypothetical protein